jgi:hypothetical protein
MKPNETTQKFIGADIGGSITHENVGQKTNKTRKHIWRFPKSWGYNKIIHLHGIFHYKL